MKLEDQRLAAQRELDQSRSRAERNRLGQYATPTALARALARVGLAQLPGDAPIRFLDPAIGTGAFYSAVRVEAAGRRVEATGVELDPAVAELARGLWPELTLREGDFTAMDPERPAQLLIANPPYVRHHHLDRSAKARLQRRVLEQTGLRISGLAGLYVHFLLLSARWMAPGGVAVWLIPSEFMDVNYGAALRRFLCQQLTLMQVHRADPTELQFEDAQVSSAVLVLRQGAPPPGHRARFTLGGSVENPSSTAEIPVEVLLDAPKWTRFPAEAPGQAPAGDALGELFTIRRGLATGSNNFFVLDEARALQLPPEYLVPILPPPRRLSVDLVEARPDGSPDLANRQWLLSCDAPLDELVRSAPALWRYLKSGVPAVSEGYLCSHRRPWYAQERREPAPLLCTYMGRQGQGRPFRFILNRSRALAANVYLMLYPKPRMIRGMAENPALLEALWRHLNGLDPAALTREGRVYGGGLFKLEPAELARLPLPEALIQLA